MYFAAYSAYRLTIVPSNFFFQIDCRPNGMGCLDGLLAPRCFASKRTDLAIAGISLWFVLSLWQGKQST